MFNDDVTCVKVHPPFAFNDGRHPPFAFAVPSNHLRQTMPGAKIHSFQRCLFLPRAAWWDPSAAGTRPHCSLADRSTFGERRSWGCRTCYAGLRASVSVRSGTRVRRRQRARTEGRDAKGRGRTWRRQGRSYQVGKAIRLPRRLRRRPGMPKGSGWAGASCSVLSGWLSASLPWWDRLPP